VSLRFAAGMALRDGRGAARTLAACGAAIGLGVASLVALGSLRLSARDAVAGQGRALVGADLALSSRRPLPDSVTRLLDSLAREGARLSRATDLATMVVDARSGGVQLLEVRAVEGGWPFYGDVRTEPSGAWAGLGDGRGTAGAGGGAPPVVLDPEAAAAVSASPGDTLTLGTARFVAVGIATEMPGRSAVRVFDRPRIYIAASALPATRLVGRGSLVTHRAWVAFPDGSAAGRAEDFLEGHRDLLRRSGVRAATPAREQARLAGEAGTGTRFLGLVGLAALLLGGLGVASGARILAATRRRSAALLRCLGASAGSVLGAYLLEALAVALASSIVGALLGVALSAWLPRIVGGLLPVRVGFRLHPGVVVAGIAVGAAAGVVFTLLPLLEVRDVPALAALRRAEVGPGEGGRWRDPWRWGAGLLIASGTVGLCVWQAPDVRSGLVYAGGLAALAGVLAVTGRALVRASRRLVPRRAPYALRQGVSNLFRPRNQTVAVVVALGLATFLVGTLISVRGNLLRTLRALTATGQPNLVLFDIQPDQKAGVLGLLREEGRPALEPTPIVVLRIADLARRKGEERRTHGGPGGGASVEEASPRAEGWALRREYRSTWRDTLTATETLAAGRWWDSAWSGGPAPAGVSLSTDIAADLAVGLGDTIAWDAGGRRIVTVVSSLREVEWARPALNFFAVFQPGALDDAPATWVVLTRAADPGVRAALQRRLVERWPNISAVDLTRIGAAVRQVAGTVEAAIRAMTALVVGAGLLVLLAAVWTSRRQRSREILLLRTLGADSATLRSILLTEYACLGGLGAATGVALGAAAGWALVTRVFGLGYRPPVGELALLWAAAVAASLAAGAAMGGGVLRRPPLESARQLEE